LGELCTDFHRDSSPTNRTGASAVLVEESSQGNQEGRQMLANWHHTLVKTAIWIAVEVCLDFVGLDNLADYSEFIWERYFSAPISTVSVLARVV
jgi:hypothetical protein